MGDVYRAFVGSIPHYYDRYLVPLIFQPYAEDLVARVRPAPKMRVLELACGTGVVTQLLAKRLDAHSRLVASDLNPAMIEIAREKASSDDRITWEKIDATDLPFGDATFDEVVCQFGVMFFPDRPRALAQARRVLRSGGRILFNTWDRLANCPVFAEADREIRACFPDDPPRFYDIPFGLYDQEAVKALVRDAGFRDVEIHNVRLSGVHEKPVEIATGIIRGGPFATEIEQRGGDVEEVVVRTARRLATKYGDDPIASPMSAFITMAIAD
ncbi:MAG: methyltransferase domain-containing protein [Candidatus Eremiobacteraeota bacterium]|nr:methyltransferase domain-containing protein [Candidatus Eremiobacteraeota bacterium]MBV8282383.1 methyltransferase domain-containing protein [Candidatus Eremiobacteraeota bacterium]